MLPRFHVSLLLAIACNLSFAGNALSRPLARIALPSFQTTVSGDCEASNRVLLPSHWRISDEPMNTPGGIGGTGLCVNPAANLAPAEIAGLAGQAALG